MADTDNNTMIVATVVNGERHLREVAPRLLLIDFLRDQLGLRGTHIGCDTTTCGACTVHVDGKSVKSCTMFAAQADGRKVLTVEGLATAEPERVEAVDPDVVGELAPGDLGSGPLTIGKRNGARGASRERNLHVLQQAFHERHALQCGYCTPGMLMSGLFLLQNNPTPCREQVKRAIAGNICRCTGYAYIVEAIQLAARRLRGEGDTKKARTPRRMPRGQRDAWD